MQRTSWRASPPQAQRYKRSLLEKVLPVKIQMGMSQAGEACLKFGTEFGAMALGVSDMQAGRGASREGEAARAEQGCAGRGPEIAGQGVGALLVLCLRCALFQSLHALAQLHVGKRSVAALPAVIGPFTFPPPHLRIRSEGFSCSPLSCAESCVRYTSCG